jgi:hypothetical protein
MNHVIAVTELDSLTQLVDILLNIAWINSIWLLFKYFEQVLFDILED